MVNHLLDRKPRAKEESTDLNTFSRRGRVDPTSYILILWHHKIAALSGVVSLVTMVTHLVCWLNVAGVARRELTVNFVVHARPPRCC